MDTANFDYVKKLVYKLSEREQRKLLNSLSWRLGDTRAQAQDKFTDDDDGDYKTREVEKKQERESYLHKVKLIMQIVNKNEKDARVFDLAARPKELRFLVNRLTYGQIGRLNFYGLCEMLRVATQAQDATNPTAYLLTSYKNLVNGKDYREKWTANYKEEQNRKFMRDLFEAERQYDEERELASRVNISAMLGGAK